MSKITREALERCKHKTLAEQLDDLRAELHKVKIDVSVADLQSQIAMRRTQKHIQSLWVNSPPLGAVFLVDERIHS